MRNFSKEMFAYIRYLFYFCTKIYEVICIFPLLLFLLCMEMRSGKLRVDFNLRLTITQQVLHTRSRFISYEVGFFVT